jgi:chromosome segregation ATPase
MSTATSYFDDLTLPLNKEEPHFEFVNAVTVSDKFAEATIFNGTISREIEEATDELARLDVELEQVKRKIGKIRRQIFADNWTKVTKTADSQIQDAFILAHAGAMLPVLEECESLEEELWKQRSQAKAKFDRYRGRLWALERMTSYLTEWLNNDKFRTRIHETRMNSV